MNGIVEQLAGIRQLFSFVLQGSLVGIEARHIEKEQSRGEDKSLPSRCFLTPARGPVRWEIGERGELGGDTELATYFAIRPEDNGYTFYVRDQTYKY